MGAVDWSDGLPSDVLDVIVLRSPGDVLDARDVANATRVCKAW
jgi:hypothetical protein